VLETPPARRRAEARIDLGSLGRNLHSVRARLSPLASGGPRPLLCAVVKADAYGHGAAVAARAFRAAGADWLAVATAVEAAVLRQAGLVDIPILVLGALTGEELKIALAAKADVVAWTDDFVAALPADARVHVKLDTGMRRFGARTTVGADRIVELTGDRLIGVMTHFATADELDDDGYFERQLRCFEEWAAEVKATRPGVIRHAANSAAVFRDPGVPIGYGDGLDRALGGGWFGLIRGERYRLVGKVSMDALTLQVPLDSAVNIGDEVILLGGELTAEAMARQLETIGYEVTARLGPRLPRVVIE
jgi:alanine racemase